MVAVVAGNGLGLFNASLNSLGGVGGFGQGGLGQAGGQAMVNASNGNLVLRFTDEQLSAMGQDLFHTRTYNAQGALTDGDADGWRWEGERKVVLSGTRNTTGSSVVRTTGDGHETRYAWNGSAYKSNEGDGAHDSLAWDAANGQWVWSEGSTHMVERYDGATGRIASMTDRSTVMTSYSYDTNGRLAAVKDNVSGQELVLIYNAAGKLARLDTRTAQGGALTQQVYYGYDTLGRLTSVSTDLTPTDNSIADGNVYTSTYAYDANTFRIARVSQSDGSAASFTYVLVDGEYRVQTVNDASGTTTFAYNTGSRRTDVTNGLNQQWSYYYDAGGQLIQVQTPAVSGQRLSTYYAYDVDGNVIRITDGLGNVLSYQYDANGNRTLERDSSGTTVTRTYDTANQLLNEIRYTLPATWNSSSATWTDPPASSAQVTRYLYDGNNRPSAMISADGNVTRYLYSVWGLLVREISYGDATYDLSALTPTQALSSVSLNAWVAARDTTRSTLVDLTYDYRGNLSQRKAYGTVNSSGVGVMDASTVITEYVHDQASQLLQTIVTRGAGRTEKTTLVSTVYDGMGRLISQVDASGIRTTTYNSASRTVSTTNTVGQTLTQSFDAAGRLISLTQTAAGVATRTTQYVYDAMGRQTMVQDMTGVRTYTFYDEAGRVSAQVDGIGAVVEYVYNAAGQRAEERRYATVVLTGSWYNGTAVIKTLVSDIRPAATAADRSTRYTYDVRGRLSTSTDAVGTVTTKTYDGRGQLVREQTGDRTIRYFFDASGRQVAQLDAEGYLSENVFDASGRLQQVIRYATATALASRAGGTLAELRPATGDNLRAWFFYDSAGRQTGSIDEQQFVTEVVYDEATHQQKTIRYGTAYAAEITAGTHFATVKAGVQTSAVIHTTTLAYDAMGRVSLRTATDGSVTAYEYDTAGRLVRETAAQGTNDERSTRTRYDAFGQAIGKLLGEASTRVITGMTDDQVAAIYAQYGLTYSYDAAGRAASVRDAQGNRSVSYYDATGRLTHVVNALGEVSETVYNAFGEASEKTSLTARLSTTDTAALTGGLLTLPVKTLVQAIRNAASDNRRVYGYDTRGLLISNTDALGFLTRYGYNGFGEQISVTRTLASGLTVTDSVSYNKRGEAIASDEDVGGLARTTATGYDAFGRVISRVDGRGLTSNVIYSGNGRRIHHSNALGQSETTDYDAFGRVLVSTDALGKTTTYTYNDATRSMTVTTPDGVSVSTVKNRHGQTLTLTDGDGKLTTYNYDKTGQLLTTLNALSQGSTNAYDNAGRLLSVTDALGRLTRYTYDASNRVVSRTAANGAITRYSFDGQGRQVRVIEAQGLPEQLVTDYAYDRNGQVLIVTQDPDGLKLTTTYTYDGAGQQVQVARGTSVSPNQQIVLYAFDKLGRRTSERLDPNGINLTTAYRYNGNDQVTRKIDPAGVSTWYVYDNAGRLTDTIDALGGVTRNTYDGSGRITRTTRFATAIAGSVVNTFGDAPASVSPSVNGAADQSTRYVHDDMGRVRYSIDARGGVTETVYSLTGKMAKSIRYNQVIPTATPQTLAATAATLASSGAQPVTTSYIYNEIGQLTSVTDAADKTESYTYDAVGNRKTLTNKNGAVWRYNYDNLNRLVEEISPAITVASISATGVVSTQVRALVTTVNYDALGHVLSRTEGRLRGNVNDSALLDDLSQSRTTRYEYDAVGHQVRITSPGWYNKSAGAFQQSADASIPANTFQVTTEVTYDALGNAVRNRIRVNNTGMAANDYADSYKVYDLLGRLSHDIDALKGVTAYTYDAQGNILTTKRYANALSATVPAAGYYKSGEITPTTLVANPTQDRTLVSTYDALGRKTAVQQDPVSLYTFIGVVATSSLITAAPTTVYTYNALGQLVRETQIARNNSGATLLTGANTFYYYDLGGNRIAAVDGLGHYTGMEYNALGKLSRQVEYATRLVSWSEGILPTPPSSNSNDRRNVFTYDAMGRLSSVTQEGVRYWQQSINAQSNGVLASQVTGSLVISQATYDGVGNLLTQKDAGGNVTTKAYNAVGHVSKIIEPARSAAQAGAVDPFSTAMVVASPITTFMVNAFGQVISETREAGKSAGNLSQSGLTQTSRTQYDAAGYTIKSIDAGNSAMNYKVDVAGRIAEESRQTSVVLSAWTVNGSAVTRSQTLRRTYGYNLLGEQISTTDWFTAADNSQKSTVNSVLYNRFGEVASQLLNGAVRASYSYNQVGRAVLQQNAQGLTQVDYDLGGNASRSNQIGDAAITTDDRITLRRARPCP
jgi:YD repeat-containing protein